MKNNSEEAAKNKIIELFKKNVFGKKPDVSSANVKHSGKDGHWLEEKMGIPRNKDNAPDIFGFEMKNASATKTTFGDWSADTYIFKGKDASITRSEFLKIFGAPNPKKENRCSWSGKPIPTINGFNDFGQILKVDTKGNISAIYSFSKDLRSHKHTLVPKKFQKNNITLARWSAENLKNKVESKFNHYGWFKCLKNEKGIYTKIVFGSPINFDTWIAGVRQGLIFFDSGMYDGNVRNYSQWRANNAYWDSLIIDTVEFDS